jgi:hypothetical protein
VDARTAFAAIAVAHPKRKVSDITGLDDGGLQVGWLFRTYGRRYPVQFGWVLNDGQVGDRLWDFEHDAEADGRRAVEATEHDAA